MKLAIIGSRDCPPIDIASQLKRLPTGIVSGGAKGADTYAREFAIKNNLPLTEYLPDYEKYGEQAPLVRNRLIVDNSDCVLAFWDGKSRGTKYTIDYAKKQGKPIKIVLVRKTIPDGLKLIIWHKLPTNALALEYCDKLEKADLQYSKISWIYNRYWYGEDHDWRWINADIEVAPENFLLACKEILAIFGDNYCFISLYRQLTSRHIWENQDKDKLNICNHPIKGGLIVKRQKNFSKSFEDIKQILENLGFTNIQKHTEQRLQYKVDFETEIIDFESMRKIEGWAWAISLKYPNFYSIDREDDWYETEIDGDYEWKVVELPKPFFDYSDDDYSYDPRFW